MELVCLDDQTNPNLEADLYRRSRGETETGIDAFVAAAIQTHERMQRDLWRLATERLWPAAGEARTDFPLMEMSRLGKQR